MREEIVRVISLLQIHQPWKLAFGIPCNLVLVTVGIIDIYFKARSTTRSDQFAADGLAYFDGGNCGRSICDLNVEMPSIVPITQEMQD